MKNRLSRLLKVLDWYPEHGGAVDVDALAMQLHTTPATIRRDLRDLREAGAFEELEPERAPEVLTAPVAAPSLLEVLSASAPANDVRGAAGADEDSLFATYVGARFLASEGNEAQTEMAAEVLRRVRAQASEALRQRMNEADLRFRFGPRSSESKVRLAVAQAITERRVLELRYRGANDQEARLRKVEPFVQYFAHDRWVFMAWCHSAGDVRQFRHERCEAVQLTEEYFTARRGLDAESLRAHGRAASGEKRVPAEPTSPRRVG